MIYNFIKPINQSDVSCETLYLDCNLIIHHVLQQTDFTGVSKYEINEHLINLVIIYMRKLVNEIIKPTNLVHIVLDGTIPNTKVFSQRIMFFQHGKKNEFDSNMIAPGTVFMQTIHDRIYGMIDLRMFTVSALFNDSYHPGEGISKIFNYIKTDNSNVVIYGETSLIVQCMSKQITGAVICCENDNVIEFYNTGECILSLLHHYNLFDKFEINERQILLDVALLEILGGNVFVTAIQQDTGLDTLFRLYASLNIKLTSLDTINWFGVQKLLSVFVNQVTPDTNPLDYYQSVLKLQYTNQLVDEVCNDYMNSILWCWKYYTSGNILSWSYKYAYAASPHISDFTTRLLLCYYDLCIFQGSPPTPFAQLLTLLPRTSHHLLPSCFMPYITSPSSVIAKQYPINETELENDSILPEYDLVINQHVVHSISANFTHDEHKRNACFI
jgi:5'-3' exonuclease